MLQFAAGRKLIAANPAKGVRLLKGEKKERFLTEAEVARLADTLTAMERASAQLCRRGGGQVAAADWLPQVGDFVPPLGLGRW